MTSLLPAKRSFDATITHTVVTESSSVSAASSIPLHSNRNDSAQGINEASETLKRQKLDQLKQQQLKLKMQQMKMKLSATPPNPAATNAIIPAAPTQTKTLQTGTGFGISLPTAHKSQSSISLPSRPKLVNVFGVVSHPDESLSSPSAISRLPPPSLTQTDTNQTIAEQSTTTAKPSTAVSSPAATGSISDSLDSYMLDLNGSMSESEKRALSGEAEAEERQKLADRQREAENKQKPEEATTHTSMETEEKFSAAHPSDRSQPAPTVGTPPAHPSQQQQQQVALSERFYGDEDAVDESVIDSHNAQAEQSSWLEKQSKVKRKEIKAVDHATTSYAPFRKNFYIESKEISLQSDDEVNAYRDRVMEGVKIRGKNCPKPIRTWIQCGFPDRVLDIIAKEGYKQPFPIQQQAMPAIMSGRDIIACAKTGSGKTLAFVLPMLRHVLDQPTVSLGEGPIAIILAPTRELATQIYNECRKFCKPLQLRLVCVYGGASVSEQISVLKRGAEIVVATPGRMIDMLTLNGGRITNLHRVTYIVMDEADRMFDMGFEPQISRIIENVRPDRQTVLFSATFPKSIESLAKKALKNPLEIIIGGKSVASSTITQFVEVRESASKFPRLLEILGKWYPLNQPILIFVDKQEAVDNLFRQLNDAGYLCSALHGGMDQQDRDFTIADFKSKLRTILVATSVVARGLDVKDLTLVVNYETPHDYSDYVHRVGRTGRAGKAGTAITFIEPNQVKYAPDLVKALTASKQVVPKDLQKMMSEFEKLRAEGKIQYAGNDGYHTRGFKFDEAEAAENKNKRLLLKMAENPDADPDELALLAEDAKTIEEAKAKSASDSQTAASSKQPSIATIASSTPATSSMANAALGNVPPAAPLDSISSQLAIAKRAAAMAAQAMAQQSKLIIAGDSNTALEADKKIADLVAEAREKAEKQQLAQAAEQAKQRAALLAQQFIAQKTFAGSANAASINASAGGGVPASLIGNLASADAVKYRAEVEINDYPQQARWRVTHKGALDGVIELTECVITSKGIYVQPGRPVPVGERKLHLLIEGASEINVQRCKAEIIRMMEEAAIDSVAAGRTDANKSNRFTV